MIDRKYPSAATWIVVERETSPDSPMDARQSLAKLFKK
jgi:hypothetical protein